MLVARSSLSILLCALGHLSSPTLAFTNGVNNARAGNAQFVSFSKRSVASSSSSSLPSSQHVVHSFTSLSPRARFSFMKMSTSTSTTTASHQQQFQRIYKQYHEGDWAGHLATFHSNTGKLIPVPEHFVPEDLIEWGQVPSCLEVLTSERLAQEKFERVVVQVLPAVGCGVDNLDTNIKKDSVDLTSSKDDTTSFPFVAAFEEDGTSVMLYQTEAFRKMNKFKCETTFLSHSQEGEEEDEDDAITSEKRIRVSFDLKLQPPSLLSDDNQQQPTTKIEVMNPIAVAMERKTSNTSSQGSVADGGGLYGSTVGRLIGKTESNKPFVERLESPLMDDLVGDWKCQKSGNIVSYTANDFGIGATDDDDDDGRRCFAFPGGITVRFGKDNPWELEVGRLNDDNSQRSVVVLSADCHSDNQPLCEVRHWIEKKQS